jgi:hypothetical protein
MIRVYYVPSRHIRSSDSVLIEHPPQGFAFAIRNGLWQKLAERAKGSFIFDNH